MLDDLRREGGGTRTVQYVHATLRAALEHAYREELVSRNVAKMVRVERPKPNPKEPLSVEEARKLLTATRDDEDHALWVVMLMLGLRRSEVCGLRWDNVDLDNRTLSITHSVQRVDGQLRELPTKTRRSTRTVPLPTMVHEALVAAKRPARSPVIICMGPDLHIQRAPGGIRTPNLLIRRDENWAFQGSRTVSAVRICAGQRPDWCRQSPRKSELLPEAL